MDILGNLLKHEHRAAGLSLEEDEDTVSLMHKGQVVVRFGIQVKPETILFEVDRFYGSLP
mgnify:CR=1 FL=1